MNFTRNQVLVTGPLGWLGSRLLWALLEGLPDHEALRQPASGLRLRCLVLPGQDVSGLRGLSDRIQIVVGDLRNPSDCLRFCQDSEGSVLFHTAGIIHPRQVSDFYRINAQGTAHLLATARQAGVHRVVVVSSNSPCGCNPHPDHLFDEQSPYRPYLNYGRSKMAMEYIVRQYRDSLETVIVRAPWFYGPNQPPRQSLFFRLIRDGHAPIVGSGENLRSMSYIDNLCQGLLLAATVPQARGQTYWIADQRPYSMNEIVDTIERLLESEFGQSCAHQRRRLPGWTSSLAYVADSVLQGIGLYHQKIHVLSEMNKTIACSIAKAQRELGYQPAVSLEEGMRRSLAWCRATGVRI